MPQKILKMLLFSLILALFRVFLFREKCPDFDTNRNGMCGDKEFHVRFIDC
jgi:hypothetical protein